MTSTMNPRQVLGHFLSPKRAWTDDKTTELNNFAVCPGLAYNVAKYYPATELLSDKDRCKELMKSLGLSSDPGNWYSPARRSKTPSPRPPSSRPSSRRRNMESFTKNPDLFYMTTHQREFGGDNGAPAANARPSTAKIFPSRDDAGETTYQTEYCEKSVKPNEMTRVGTSSGNRRNNPHPSEAFMVWKFPGRGPPALDPCEYNTENMEEVCFDHLKSTYQSDYTGIPQGVQVQTVFEGDVKYSLKKPPRTLDSTARHSYQKPLIRDELKCNFSRYGANKNKYKPTVGAVPTVSAKSPQMHLYGRTHYSHEYYRKELTRENQKHYKSGPIPALEEFLNHAKPQEKENLIKSLQKIASQGNKHTRDPDWLSQWSGPS